MGTESALAIRTRIPCGGLDDWLGPLPASTGEATYIRQ